MMVDIKSALPQIKNTYDTVNGLLFSGALREERSYVGGNRTAYRLTAKGKLILDIIKAGYFFELMKIKK